MTNDQFLLFPMLSYGYKNTVGAVAHLFFSDPPFAPHAIGGDLNGGAGQVAAIEGGEGGSQELCPDEEKNAADNRVEVTEPPFIMVEAYTVGGGGGGGGTASPGREQDLSTTSGGHTQARLCK